MQEKIITGRKYGMAVLLGYLALLAAAVLAIICGAVRGHGFFVVLGVLYVSLGWIALCGLRILKPQEALVLTLIGKYIGTLKGEGFYYVNPFCSAVNPAANTKLSQSGDVGKYTGYYYTFSMAAQIVTPIASGWLLEHVGYHTLFPYAAAMTGAAFFTMLFVRHGDSRPEAAKSVLEHFDAAD